MRIFRFHPINIFVFLSILSFLETEGFPFVKDKIDGTIQNWERENKNEAIVLFYTPLTGKIEYVYSKKNAYREKLPIGSLMKPLSASVFLSHPDEFNFNPIKTIHCSGKFTEPSSGFFKPEDREKFNIREDGKTGYFRCAVENGHGDVDLHKAIVLSCNVYFLSHAANNPEIFHKSLVQNWNLKTGTGAVFENNSTSNSIQIHSITDFEYSLSSIGEGSTIKLTPLKIAQIYGSIFEDTPILVPAEETNRPLQQFASPLTEMQKRIIQKALRSAVKEGTLKDLNLKNTSIKLLAGKTGTATKEKKKILTHGWNILHIQKGKTRLLLLVFVRNGSGKKEALSLSSLILHSL